MISIQTTILLTIVLSSSAHESFPKGEQMVDISRTEMVRGDGSQNRLGYQVNGGQSFCGTGKTCSANDIFSNCCPQPDGICCGATSCCQRGQSCCAGRCCPTPDAICCYTYCCNRGSRCSGHNDGRCIPYGNNAMGSTTSTAGCISSLTLAYLLGLHRLYLMI